MNDANTPTPEQAEALDIARELIAAGIPVFAAPPCPSANGGTCERKGHAGKEEYDLPPKWQLTVPSEVNLERWRPGWALGAVGGHAADFLDEDPRNGGSASVDELKATGHWPRLFGIQQTPSGGFHYIISPLGERETNGFMPGIDYQGGAPGGKGRAFVWIAPTVKRSKAAENAGQRGTYRWLERPDLDYLAEFSGGDDSVEGIRMRLAARPAAKTTAPDDRQARTFNEETARQFCNITIERLTRAKVGEIEEAANAAACTLSRFVPDFWSEEHAFNVLLEALKCTDYDPDHPAATWHADKFQDVIGGRNDRAPQDWKAIRETPAGQLPAPELVPDADVDALLAKMRTPDQMENSRSPQHLIRGLLTLDSESWMVGGPGSKKSFVALDMAARVSTGQRWQELETTQGPVVFIVAEGVGGSGKRIKAWHKTFGQMGDVRFLPEPVQAGNAGAWAVLIKACRRIKPVLIVLDTQARITVGLEENSAKDMGMFVDRVRELREATGACVLVIHHTGRKGADARGSSALDGAQSTELTVEVPARSLTGRLRVSKQKDIDEIGDMPLHFSVVDLGLDEFGATVDSLVLLTPDAWRDASGVEVTAVETGQVVRVPEPAEWTHELVKHNRQHVHRCILMVMQHVAGEAGLTEPQVQRIVRDRWYAGRPLRDAEAGHLAAATWGKAWGYLRTAVAADGESVMVNVRGEKWALNPAVAPLDEG